MIKFTKASIVHALLASIVTVLPLKSARAGPGTLPAAPLFLSTLVEPNVFMTLDDSGSMDWGPLVKNNTAGLATDQGLPIIDNDDRGYYTPTFSRLYTNRGYLPPWGMNKARHLSCFLSDSSSPPLASSANGDFTSAGTTCERTAPALSSLS